MDVRLPPEEEMKYARSGWCHLFGCLVDAYQLRGDPQGYKKIPDSEIDNCFNILQIAYDYAEDPNVYDRFPKVDQAVIDEIHHVPHDTLDEWFK